MKSHTATALVLSLSTFASVSAFAAKAPDACSYLSSYQSWSLKGATSPSDFATAILNHDSSKLGALISADKSLVNTCVSVKTFDDGSAVPFSPLALAASVNDLVIAKQLNANGLERDLECPASNGFKFNPLDAAIVYSGDATMVDYLLNGVKIRFESGFFGWASSALHYAIFTGKKDSAATIIRYLGKGMVDLAGGRVGVEHITPLECAAEKGDYDSASLLLENQADPSAATANFTVLQASIASGNLDLVKLLVKKGADVNATFFYGWSPLMYAAEVGLDGAIQALLENKADASYRVRSLYPQSDGPLMYSAFDISAMYGRTKAIATLASFDQNGSIVKSKNELDQNALIAYANSNAYAGYDERTLNRALKPEVVQALLDAGVSKLEKDRFGKTAYDYAKEQGWSSATVLSILKP